MEDNEQKSGSSEDEEIVATFKKEEIKKLEDEGFTVVGKPKVKARDQKDYHDRQHGRKNHHNYHRNKN